MTRQNRNPERAGIDLQVKRPLLAIDHHSAEDFLGEMPPILDFRRADQKISKFSNVHDPLLARPYSPIRVGREDYRSIEVLQSSEGTRRGRIALKQFAPTLRPRLRGSVLKGGDGLTDGARSPCAPN